MSALDMLNDPMGGMSGGTSIKGGDAAPSQAHAYGGHAVTGAFNVGGAATANSALSWAQSLAPLVMVVLVIWLVVKKS